MFYFHPYLGKIPSLTDGLKQPTSKHTNLYWFQHAMYAFTIVDEDDYSIFMYFLCQFSQCWGF